MSHYKRLSNGTVWPSRHQGDIEHSLRYGSVADIGRHRLVIASILDAYMELIMISQKRRNQVCTELAQEDKS